jgi:hypothetical protein
VAVGTIQKVPREVIARAAVVWEHAGKDCGSSFTRRIGETVDRSRFQCQSGLEKKKCLRNGFEKSNPGPWDFHVTAEKAMQPGTWLEAYKLKQPDINYRLPGK